MASEYPASVYDGNPPRVHGSDTSVAAAESVRASAPGLRERVERFVRRREEHGATDDEIEIASGLAHQTISARRRELVLLGCLRDSGLRRPTRSGRSATVWVASLQAERSHGDCSAPRGDGNDVAR